jgi:DNA-binding NtrC family response regulator
MDHSRILIVEDEELMRRILRSLLEAEGYVVFSADSAETAVEIFSSDDITLTLTDIKMSGRDGLALLDQIKTLDAEAVVIVMTAYSSVDTAVAALRKGAYDYITKPFVNEDLLQTVRNAVENRRLFNENRLLRRELRRQYDFAEIVGKSDALLPVFDLVRKVAATSATVLIQGETGTGKELIARAIHFNSDRNERPFVAVNCGALPEGVLESELFGHVQGAFTGAVADKKGLFRSAAGGTILLDEIGEMPLSLQVRLLRALQEHEVMPVGSSSAIKFDARVIASTNKKLGDEVAAGRFREDLYYRLNVVEIEVPPLRARRDDIPLLVNHFVARFARSQNAVEKPVTADALVALERYGWPGNIRELEHVLERAFILSGDETGIDSLPASITGPSQTNGHRPTLDDVEKKYILDTLDETRNDKAEAARLLGIDLSTLYRKLKRYEPE